MNPWIGWTLALLVLIASWRAYGTPGLALGVTVIVFWLVLQFNRSIRVMKNAGSAPVGHIDSAVMLNAQLKMGMNLLKVLSITRSLGRPVSQTPERWAWQDPSGAAVTLRMEGGRLQSWTLVRPAEELADAPAHDAGTS